MSDSITACPLDCFDACSIIYKDGKLSGVKSGHTQGFLCPHLNHYKKYERILAPSYKGENISMSEALLRLVEMLNASPNNVLHYRGHGNFALMQAVTEHFFSEYGALSVDGSLCDGAGEAGIIKGRGSNKNMPLNEIEKSEVVIVWGRNPHTTSSHILPLLKNKKLIVIDPVNTKIAKVAELFIQIEPNKDVYLAMLVVAYLHSNNYSDKIFLEKFTQGYEEYIKLVQNINKEVLLEEIGSSFEDIKHLVELINGKKVAIVCGLGIQKYKNGANTMQAIDALAVTLGLFTKEGCGVSYLGNSKEKIVSPFSSKAKKVSRVDTAFDKYKTLFIQATNPLSQMPDTLRVKKSLEGVENIVYFGLYENETSTIADLVIPAKTFLEKNDVRTSYSHNGFMFMAKQEESSIGISEYDLTRYLCNEFKIELKSEAEYLNHFKSFSQLNKDGTYDVKNRDEVPYKDGFDTKSGKFEFLEKLESSNNLDKSTNELYLITPKSAKSLNSQFHRESAVYIHSQLGFREDENVNVSSLNGSVLLKVKYNDDLRKDCVLIYSGTPNLNNLTTCEHSSDGKSAIYQENRVIITDII